MARIGLMGCGSVADFGHIPAILRTPGLDLVGLYDPNEERVRTASEKFGHIPSFIDSDEFFALGLDGVVIASSATAHLTNVLDAAKHNVHVLCEKPLAMTDGEADVMITAMEAADCLLMVGFVYRFSPVAYQLREWVREKTVGEIRSLRLIYVWGLHGQYEQDESGAWVESPRWKGRMLEGGPMVDCGVHQIDLARWWLGSEVKSFHAHGAWVSSYEAPDHVYLHLDHECGAHTMVEMSFTYGHTARDPRSEFSYHLIGTGGVARYDRDGYVLEARTGQATLHVPGASEKNFDGMHAAFSETLRTGRPGDLPTGRDGLIATQIARKATEQVIQDRVPTS